MHVGDILRNQTRRMVTVAMSETIGIAARLMRASQVGALVVKASTRSEDKAVVGLFTERDVVRAVAERGASGLNAKIAQFLSAQAHLRCSSQDTLTDVQELMNRYQVRHVPVIDNSRLAGVISLRDIIEAVDEATVGAAQAA